MASFSLTKEFSADPVRLPAGTFSDDDIHRAALWSYDPHVRAALWIEVLQMAGSGSVADLPATPQLADTGRTFFGMHPSLRRVALGRLVR